MDNETQEKAIKAMETLKRKYKYQNDYISKNYERQTVTLPKGTKERIKNLGYSVNGFINELIKKEFERIDPDNKI